MHPCFMRFKINNSTVFFIYFFIFISFFLNHSLIQAYIHNTKKTNDFIKLIFLLIGYSLSMEQRLFCASDALSMIAQLQNILTSSRQLHALCENPVVKGIKKIVENCEKKRSGLFWKMYQTKLTSSVRMLTRKSELFLACAILACSLDFIASILLCWANHGK